MINVKVKSSGGIAAYAAKLRSAEKTIVNELLRIGENEANKNILQGTAADGNTSVFVDTIAAFNGGKVNMNGDDVAYQEFGYGMPGQTQTHPKLPAGYSPSNKTRWVYFDTAYATWRTSYGMPPQMPMYLASKEMRNRLVGLVKKRTAVIKRRV